MVDQWPIIPGLKINSDYPFQSLIQMMTLICLVASLLMPNELWADKNVNFI